MDTLSMPEYLDITHSLTSSSDVIEILDNCCHLAKEPRLRRFVGYEDEPIMVSASLVREPYPRILDGDTLDHGEG